MGRITTVRRTVSTVAATTALLAGMIISGAGPANARLTDDGIFIACPDATTLATISSPSCQNLSVAVASAESWNATSRSNATIDLLPGKYCPVSLPYDPYDITIQGLGFAGLANASDVSSYTGFEADLSEFTWIAGTCAGSPAAFLTNLANPQQPSEIWGDLTFQNFAVNGTGGTVSDGIDVTNASLGGRDLLVENLTGIGVHWSDAFNFYNGGIENSAFIGNGTGTSISTGGNHGFSVDEATYAGNTTGIVGAGSVNVGGDTIAHNTTGLSGTFSQVVGSIIGDNTTNCVTNSYEDFGDSVYGPGCHQTTGDVPLTSTMGQPSTTGPAITPSIAPPGEASGLTSGGICVATQDGVDQEEASVSALSSCYAGSIQPAAAVDDPAPSPSPQDFGAVPTNEPATATVYLSSAGGLTDVTGVTVATDSGTGSFAVNYTTCEYSLLFMQFDRGNCLVSVTATATDSSGETDGTLTFHTGSGDIVDDLTLTGAPAIVPPAAPTSLSGTAASHEVDLSWHLTPEADDGGQPIQYYEVYDSVDGGNTWNEFYSQYDTTTDPATISVNFDIANNTTYEFRVVANNGLLNSAPSNTISLTPEGAATSIAAPPKMTIVWGKSGAIRTTLKSLGQPVGGYSVHLQKKVPGTTTWTSVGSTTTAANGSASVSAAPTNNIAYRWVFTGNNTYAPSTSAATTVRVAQAITAKLSAASVKHGKKVKIYGSVSPNAKNQKVTVQLKSKHGWKAVGTAKLILQKLPNGKKALGFVFSYKPTAKGKQKLRVTNAPTSTNAAGTSTTVTLKVV